jgi:hypothetical protein
LRGGLKKEVGRKRGDRRQIIKEGEEQKKKMAEE